MDPICHTLVGGALAQAGLKHRTPLATAALVIGANVPDVDGLAYLLGESLWWRRGWTHGVLALVAWPVVLTAALIAWDRLVRGTRMIRRHPPPRPAPLLGLAALAVLTHPTLDYLNNYGLRWLMPFQDRWFYGDALFIADPWIWGALGLGTLVSWRVGRDASRTGRHGRAAWLALAAVTVYAAAMLALGQAGRAVVRQQFAARGIAVVGDPMVSPVFADPFTRYVVASDGSRYHVAAFRWWPAPRLGFGARVIPVNAAHPAVAAARASAAARGFLHWARFPFFSVRDDGTAYVVTMDDARYAPSDGMSWAAVQVRVPRQSASGIPRLAPQEKLLLLAAERPAPPGPRAQALAAFAAWCGG